MIVRPRGYLLDVEYTKGHRAGLCGPHLYGGGALLSEAHARLLEVQLKPTARVRVLPVYPPGTPGDAP